MVWIVTALLLAPLSQIPQAFSTMGASVRDLLFAPVLMLQYAVQFIQLAVPSSAARVALEVRFFQRQGVETGGALSIGLIDSVSGFVIQIVLILIITLSGLASLDLSTSRLQLVEQRLVVVRSEPPAPGGGADRPRRHHRAR